MSTAHTIPLPGFCQCGCGELAPISKRTRYDIGHVKGEPIKFIRGHNGTTPAKRGYKVCTGCGEEKKLKEFAAHFRADRGKTSPKPRCRPCAREYARARRRVKPPKYYPRLTSEEKLMANRKRVKEWRAKNPEKRRRTALRYFYKRRGVPLDAEAREWADTILAFDVCCYCGVQLGSTMDHIVPVSSGGDSDWTNLSAACLECNSGKGSKDLLSYLLHRKTYGGHRYS